MGRRTRAPRHPALRGVDLSLRPGRRVAIVGPSGAGKSTLAAVLAALPGLQAGSVALSGTPLDRLAGDDLRTVVGLVGQDAYLFDTTIAENLGVGRREATDAETARRPRPGRTGRLARGPARGAGHRGRPAWVPACRVASASGSRWPAPCWPTSRSWSSTSRPSTSTSPAADALTADLLDVTDGRSLVLITHRLAGLECVDEILVMDAGRVVERGTHDAAARPGRPVRRPVVGGDETERNASLDPTVHPAEPDTDSPMAATSRGHLERRESHPMSTDLARWQFATTSIYHFLFVPVTIGLAFLVALLQTSWYRNDNPTFKRLTKFFGTLLLINVAIGVVTGLVQEFEFGMNWSNYSRFVGNIFGGPLAMEGLAGLLPGVHLPRHLDLRVGPPLEEAAPDLHLAGGGGVACCRALFIMAANSWMQHPVGYVMNSQHQPRAQRHLGAVHQPGLPVGLPPRDPGLAGDRSHRHAGRLGLAPAAQECGRGLPPDRHHLAGRPHPGRLREHVHRQRARGGRGQVPADEDRGRRGAVDHLPVALPLLAVPDRRRQQRRDPHPDLEVPDLLSILATNHLDGEVQGLNNLQAQYVKEYGPGNYIPNVFIQYWGMRVMAYLAALIALFALWGLWLIRRKTLDQGQMVPVDRPLVRHRARS